MQPWTTPVALCLQFFSCVTELFPSLRLAAVSKYEEKTRFIRELQTDLENRIDETNQEGEDVQATLRDLEEERRRLQEQLVQTVENELAP